MPIKLTVAVPGGTTLELTCDSNHEVFQQLAFWSKLPHTCPIDGYPTYLGFKAPQGNEYYEVVSTGPIPWSLHVGQRKNEDKTLYLDDSGVWSYWDAERREEVQRRAQGGDAGSAPKSPQATSNSQRDTVQRPSETTAASDDSPPWPEDENVGGELYPDNQMVKAFLAVSEKMGFTRENVEKGAQIYFKTTDLNSLDYAQIQQLTERMKKRKAELDAKGA